MNAIWRILKMPWVATVRTGTWALHMLIWVILGFEFGYVPIGHASHVNWLRLGVVCLGLIVGAAWSLVANAVWLARDARDLRLPGIEQAADLCPPVYALLSIVLPAAILGAIFGHTLMLLTLLALIASTVLALGLLPARWTIVLIILILVVFYSGLGLLHTPIPLPGDPGFFAWTVPAVVLLGVACTQRWIGLRRSETLAAGRWQRSGSLNMRMARIAKLGGGTFEAIALARNDDTQRQPAASFPNIGPPHIVRSLRVALGSSLKPVGIAAANKRRVPPLVWGLIAVMAVPALALLARWYVGADSTVRAEPFVLMIAGILGTTFGLAYCKRVQSLWTGTGAALPLLALLPKLGAAERVKRAAVCACLQRGMIDGAFLLPACLLGFAALRVPAVFYLYLMLMLACGVLLNLTLVTHTLGGKPLRSFVVYGLRYSPLVPIVVTMAWGVRVTKSALLRYSRWAGPCSARSRCGWRGYCFLRELRGVAGARLSAAHIRFWPMRGNMIHFYASSPAPSRAGFCGRDDKLPCFAGGLATPVRIFHFTQRTRQ